MEQSLYLSASVMDYLHLPHSSGWYPLLLSQEQESQRAKHLQTLYVH